METKLKILAVVLGLQLVAALALSMGEGRLSPALESGPLLAVDKAAVDRIGLWGPDGEEILLSKGEAGWMMTQLEGFPANNQRVQQLLDRLSNLTSGAPVAHSSDAQKRFKVSEAVFERKVRLSKGDTELATLYLGTTPGMRRIHARRADAAAIHRVEMADYDVPVNRDAWLDKTVLQFSSDEVEQISVHDLKLKREGIHDGEGETYWTAQGLQEGEALNAPAVDSLANLLATLEIGSVLGRESRADYGLEAPVLELQLTRHGKDDIHYQLGKSPENEEYTLKLSDRPEYFRLPIYRANPLLNAGKREALVQFVDEM